MHVDLIRDAATVMPVVPSAKLVTSLVVWHCKYKSLEALSRFPNLTVLKIATYPNESFEPLASLEQLKWASILHFPKVGELDPLGKLKSLKSLELATLPSWDSSRKRQVVKSLEPLAGIRTLTNLALFGVVPQNRSLASLQKCVNLMTLKVSGYPSEEVKRYYEASGVNNSGIPISEAA